MSHTHSTLSASQGVLRFVLFVFGTAAFIAWKPLFGAALILAAVVVYLLSHYLTFGFYIMVALAMMTEWKIYLTDYHAVFQDYPKLLAINAPVMDVWVVLLLLAFAWAYLRKWFKGSTPQLLAPGLYWYSLFLITAFLSLFNLPIFEVSAGVKFIFRFLVFLYLAYIILGVNICRKKETLLKALQILGVVGIVAAVMGFVSLFLGLWNVGGFTRAVPFALFGWAPFGYQHILLAEILTTTLPIATFFYLREETAYKKWWGIGALLILFTAILTLSRAAILTIGIEVIVLLYFFRDNKDLRAWISKHTYTIASLAIVLLATSAYAATFILTNPTVTASSEARGYLTDVSFHLFSQHPVIGNGAGSFVTRLAEVSVFRLEFGDPLEAHGIVQKLLSEQGILGLITFALFLIYILRRLVRRYQHDHYTVEARFFSLLGFFLILSPLVFQLFNTQYYSSKMWIPIMLAMAQFTIYKKDRKHGKVFQGDIQRSVVADA